MQPCIKEEEELQLSSLPMLKNLSNSQLSFDNFRYRRLYSLPASEDDNSDVLATYLNDKLSIKLRYLLQLFIEANCTDYALMLSILLQDAASISRIVNVVIRSESVGACRRIEAALKQLSQCTFDNEGSLYRGFVMTLQPHIYLLEQYIQSLRETPVHENGDDDNELRADAASVLENDTLDGSNNNFVPKPATAKWQSEDVGAASDSSCQPRI